MRPRGLTTGLPAPGESDYPRSVNGVPIGIKDGGLDNVVGNVLQLSHFLDKASGNPVANLALRVQEGRGADPFPTGRQERDVSVESLGYTRKVSAILHNPNSVGDSGPERQRKRGGNWGQENVDRYVFGHIPWRLLELQPT